MNSQALVGGVSEEGPQPSSTRIQGASTEFERGCSGMTGISISFTGDPKDGLAVSLPSGQEKEE